MLGEVLSTNKAMLEGGVTRQICSLRSPITPPPPSHHHTLHLLTLGHINTVLVLEDHGPIDQSKDNNGTSLASASSVRPLPITTAHQNLTSAETVPTWTTSHVVPQATIDVPRFAPGVGLGVPPASRTTFDPSVGGQALTVGPSHLGYLPPSSQQQFSQPPPHNTSVHVPVSGK